MVDMHVDWRGVGSDSHAWFGASSHVHAASLAGRVVDVLPDGVALPDLDIRGDGVRVRVRGNDQRADALQAISEAARALELAADPSMLQHMRLRFDSGAPTSIASFWKAALRYEDVDADTIGDRLRRCPPIRFEQSADARPLRNRLHLDSGHPGPIGETVTALRAAGGREAFACEWYSTVADVDGNEVDLVPGSGLGDESTADWSVLFGAMACYPAAAPRQSAELAVAAAHVADDAGIPLMIDVRPEGVVLDSGKDQWEADGFADLARAAQGAARAIGLTSDTSGLRFVQIGIDAVDIPAVREFWRTVLGYVRAPDARITDLYDPRQLEPVVFLQDLDATDTDRRRQRNRVHVELLLPAEAIQPRVDAAVAAGGRILDGGSPDRRRLADPEGNEIVLHPVTPP